MQRTRCGEVHGPSGLGIDVISKVLNPSMRTIGRHLSPCFLVEGFRPDNWLRWPLVNLPLFGLLHPERSATAPPFPMASLHQHTNTIHLGVASARQAANTR